MRKSPLSTSITFQGQKGKSHFFSFKPRESFPSFSSLMLTKLQSQVSYKLLLRRGQLASQRVFGVSGCRFNTIYRTETQPNLPQDFCDRRSGLHLLPCMATSVSSVETRPQELCRAGVPHVSGAGTRCPLQVPLTDPLGCAQCMKGATDTGKVGKKTV